MSLRSRLLFLCLLIAGVAGVVSVYDRLSRNYDEVAHVNCGKQWWADGIYIYEPLHPPLARIFAGSLYTLFGVDESAVDTTGVVNRADYIHNTVMARLGVLPFYIVSCLLVFYWSRQLFGLASALWSLALYITLSTVTAHAAFATTDVAYAAMFTAAMWAFTLWLHTPSMRHTVLLGLVVGLTLGSKFSALVHVPASVVLILLVQMLYNLRHKQPLCPLHLRHISRGLFVAAPTVVAVIALLYRFDFDPLFKGIQDVATKNRLGHAVWLFGPLNHHGVWYFFPVVFFFKTPIPFHIATIVGHMRIFRSPTNLRAFYPLLAALGVLLASMPSNINIGVRHVLPMYPLLVIPAGYGMLMLWQSTYLKRLIAAALLAWQAYGFITHYPEHIAYFNEFGGNHPERISMDSDFNWGHNFLLIDDALRARDIRRVRLCELVDFNWLNMRLLSAEILPCPNRRMRGWWVVSRSYRMMFQTHFTWLEDYEPVQAIGSTADLYWIEK